MLAIVPRVVWALLSIVGRTWRFEVIAEEGVTPVQEGQKAGSEIYCFWHQCVLPCAFYFRGSGAVILISRSFDGELITRILKLFGFDAVRGSSSRGGREGLLGLAHVIGSGRTAIFTADGPRGPIFAFNAMFAWRPDHSHIRLAQAKALGGWIKAQRERDTLVRVAAGIRLNTNLVRHRNPLTQQSLRGAQLLGGHQVAQDFPRR